MTDAHLHLLINHFPIVGNVVSILLLVWALIRKSNELMKLALGFTILVTLFGYVSDFTGDEAEDQVKELSGITREAVHEHEEAADWAMDFLYGTAAASLIALYLLVKNKKQAKIFIYLTLGLALFTSTVLFRTGYLGGLIRHPEISTSAQK